MPSSICKRSQRSRRCSSRGTSEPSGSVRAARRASVSNMSASSPATSPSAGRSLCIMRVSRIASAVRSARFSAAPELVRYPSLNTRYSTCSTTRSRLACSDCAGSSKRAPALRMLSLARLIRWAIVASGTRNALAISAVVNPPTALRVRASCEGTESDGWQHRNSRARVSS